MYLQYTEMETTHLFTSRQAVECMLTLNVNSKRCVRASFLCHEVHLLNSCKANSLKRRSLQVVFSYSVPPW